MSKKNKSKKNKKKYKETKHLRVNNYNPEMDLNKLTGGWYNMTVKQFLGLAKSEMNIKNHLYKFITHKGLMDEYRDKRWEVDYDKNMHEWINK